MSVSVEVEGLDTAIEATKKLAEQIGPTVFKVNMGVADRAVYEAQQLAPYRTGALRRSISIIDVDDSTLTCRIAASVPYAAFVEEGTWKMQGWHFMRQGVEKAIAGLDAKLREALRGIV